MSYVGPPPAQSLNDSLGDVYHQYPDKRIIVSCLGETSFALETPPCSTVTSPKYLLSAWAPTPMPTQEKEVRTSNILEPKGFPIDYVLLALAVIS